MVKASWGVKRTCQNCRAVFYDMKKEHPICPKCGAKFDPDAVGKTGRGRQSLDNKHKKSIDADSEDIAVDTIDDAEAEVLEDTEDLDGVVDIDVAVDVEERDDGRH